MKEQRWTLCWTAEHEEGVGPNHPLWQAIFTAPVARQRISRLFVLAAGCSRSDCRRSAAGSEWNGGETASSWRSGLGRVVPQQGCLCRVCMRGWCLSERRLQSEPPREPIWLHSCQFIWSLDENLNFIYEISSFLRQLYSLKVGFNLEIWTLFLNWKLKKKILS